MEYTLKHEAEVCEFCFRTRPADAYGVGWQFIGNAAVCGECMIRLVRDHGQGWKRMAKVGCYADPRTLPEEL